MLVSLKLKVATTPEGTFVVVQYLDAEEQVGPIQPVEDCEEYVVLLNPSDPNGVASCSAKKNRRRAMRCEEDIAKAIGGNRQKGSGAIPHIKGDVRKKGRMRVESKFTRTKSFRVELSELEKIRSECSANETPAFDITFVNPKTTATIDEWTLVPRSYVAEKENK
jgi:hypothetical protein